MKKLVLTPYFKKQLGEFAFSHPELEQKTIEIMDLLAKNKLLPKLKIHKLSGKMKSLYSASIDYRYRIIFSINTEMIIFFNIGTHDEVY